MNERREPTISSTPIEGRDEAQRARAQQAKKAQPVNRTTINPSQRTARPGPPPVSSRPVVVKSKLAPLTFVLLILVSLFAGFMYWQLMTAQNALATTSQTLQNSIGRIEELEKKLMLSDDESTQSMIVIQATVKENASEIRKLWGVAYDRNRKAIAALQESVTQVESTVAKLGKQVKSSGDELAGEMRVLSELVDAQQAAISRADTTLDAQQKVVVESEKKLKALDEDLKRRVMSNEEAIKAIDAFRLQVNREILQLKGG